MSLELELGTLVVVVLKARNLNDKHSFYKQDVYAQVSMSGATQRTPVDVKGGQHPVWDVELRVPIMKQTGEKHRTLEVSCWAKEHKVDDLLGAIGADT
jgi:Ca2+-dependent lipid-binding protein